jgi:hypothetical protein
MKATKYLLNEAIKSILVNMAINDELPMDMNNLDIHSIVEQAENDCLKDPMYNASKRIDNALEILSVDEDDTIEKQLALIEEAADKDLDMLIDHIDGVYPWEKVEFEFTIREFLDYIA